MPNWYTFTMDDSLADCGCPPEGYPTKKEAVWSVTMDEVSKVKKIGAGAYELGAYYIIEKSALGWTGFDHKLSEDK